MADYAHITMHGAFTARALATMGADPAWDLAVTKYLRADALYRADEAFGRYSEAVEVDTRAELDIETQFGRTWRSVPAAMEMRRHSLLLMREAEKKQVDQFLRSLWQAQRELAQTPAPTLAAVLFKVELMEVEEVWNDINFEGDAFEMVAADFARLTGETTC